ncbi:HAMP domain-containing methyl-accepting chemotaxis protein [Shinella sp. CPCC 100929]|uniref:HAMP domain-containing methyl-accepting chemotaxis protein n=1 Tax=Shinella lacus TaxID=2654216 RepID=A0ABT1R0U1_9HYPH|nr:HAMP domain-containing methyl-accepting chemotaxis protein [Shinella lacus]MCQ4628751.1 HAMP domain-containing methyl-accepting chemotaxis protein [Shinella lacus]
MRNIPIISKFLVILCAFGLFVAGVIAYSSSRLSLINTSYTALLEQESTAALTLARTSRSLVSIRSGIADLLLAHTEEARKAALADIELSKGFFVQQIDLASAAMPSRTSFKVLKDEGLNALNTICAPLIAAATGDADTARAQAEFRTTCQPVFTATIAKLTDEITVITDIANARRAELGEMSRSTIVTTIIGVIAGLIGIMIAGFFAVRAWIARPLNALSATMATLAGGDLSVMIAETERRDEIGGMARAVQVFKDNGLRTRALETSSAAERTAAEAERERNTEVDRVRAAAMTQATGGLAEGLKRMAGGDLGFELTQAFSEEFESLRQDFNAAVSQLRTTLQAVSETTVSIDSGSRELSQAANDLSRRTEQQAAALEETAAALDEITANVSQSSKRAEEARSKASEANAAAHHSAKVVSEAVTAMQRIEGSSGQISNIIGVIDEIAFQTNLLALNAGVEAARAGEAGKGFAVVAQEVRELAQRSAQAAKEIKELIRNSAGEVEGGVRLVTETGEALKVIGQHVNDINAQLDAIATSAREQSVGLVEVNSAVNQMDQTTQQNAAMVEQSTAASASLAKEADRLRELVGQFQVGSAAASDAGRGFAPAPTRPHLKVANTASLHVASPAKRMVGKLASAFGGGSAAAAAEPGWDEF